MVSPAIQAHGSLDRLDSRTSSRLQISQGREIADVVLPWDGRDHYLAGVYRTDLARRADELVGGGERSMRALVNSVDTQRVVMVEQSSLTNVNTPADLA